MMRQLFATIALLIFVSASAAAGEVFGTVDDVAGSATVTGADGSSASINNGMKIYELDTIKTGADGEVHIVTEDGALLALRPNSEFRIDAYKAQGGSDDKSFLSLVVGGLRSITGWIGGTNHDAYRISTPTATIGVRGTDHEVTVVAPGGSDAAGTYETVNDGSTVMKTPQGEVVNTPGKFAFAPRGGRGAPSFLQHAPRFWGARRLRLEGRIAERKAYLRGHRDQMRRQRIREFQSVRTNGRDGQARVQRHPGQRGAFRLREGERGQAGQQGRPEGRRRERGEFRLRTNEAAPAERRESGRRGEAREGRRRGRE